MTGAKTCARLYERRCTMAAWTMIALSAVTLGVAPSTTGCDQNPAVRCEQGDPVGDLGIDALRCNCTVTSEPGHRTW